ncbi:MAG: helix-turn-helix transcriptional regulator [Fimbriimonas sp.]|nr:helix-turn-helix transcriptional regulator [Fimbriimonas sp.]
MARSSIHISGNLFGLILAVLESAPLHGYGIAREIEIRSSDALSFGEGTLYPALRALEQDGFIEARWDTSGTGPAKKVYELTPDGKAELARIREAWRDYSRSIDQVLGGLPKMQSA